MIETPGRQDVQLKAANASQGEGLSRYHYRFEQDESLTKIPTHSENAIKSI